MTPCDDSVAGAVQHVRSLVQADGGDLEVVRCDGGIVEVLLVLENAGCAECVMPRAFLEQVLLDHIRRTGVSIDVVVRDPREAVT